MGRLNGKVAVITGAASGIGAAAARLFVQEGARVMLADILRPPLHELATELASSAAFFEVDITDENAVQQLIETTVRQFGQLDIALLNAGITGQPSPLTACPVSVFDQVMAVNVRGTWLGLKYAMQAMQEMGGSIIVTSSTSGVRATPNMSSYVTSKHALIGMVRAAALEGATHGIRVNSVNPATIDTPMVRSLEERSSPATTKLSTKINHIPLGRQGTAEEVARTMLFLASDEASFSTGGIYMVDGGVTAGRAI